jgi:hypothetical protein
MQTRPKKNTLHPWIQTQPQKHKKLTCKPLHIYSPLQNHLNSKRKTTCTHTHTLHPVISRAPRSPSLHNCVKNPKHKGAPTPPLYMLALRGSCDLKRERKGKKHEEPRGFAGHVVFCFLPRFFAFAVFYDLCGRLFSLLFPLFINGFFYK